MSWWRGIPLLVLALVTGGAACSKSSGLKINVDPAEFGDAVSLRVVVGAEGGFVMQPANNVSGARVTTEDLNGDGLFEL